MEKRIYYNLAMVATITVIITSLVLVFLFYDLYNSQYIHGYIDLGSMFLSMLPAMVGLLVFILILLYLVSYILTNKIIKPIEMTTKSIESILSGREVESIDVYEELRPFIRTIQIQKMEIENYILKLKEAEKTRRDFTANVSHELKTPLTSINGFAEILSTGTTSREDTVKFANIIHKEGANLLGLIDSIINLSRIETVSSDKVFTTVNITDIANDIISKLKIRAREKKLNLNLVAEDIEMHGDKRMLEDLLYNLIDNGIKYNKPEGKVDVFISKISDNCIININDTGVGIPEDEQDKVFERFYMVDKSRSKKVGGSGLGLSIVKHIVIYHNGKISLDSKLDEGTKIEIVLPIDNKIKTPHS